MHSSGSSGASGRKSRALDPNSRNQDFGALLRVSGSGYREYREKVQVLSWRGAGLPYKKKGDARRKF